MSDRERDAVVGVLGDECPGNACEVVREQGPRVGLGRGRLRGVAVAACVHCDDPVAFGERSGDLGPERRTEAVRVVKQGERMLGIPELEQCDLDAPVLEVQGSAVCGPEHRAALYTRTL